MDEDLKKNILATGTSLVGIVCKDGVVMASDKKVTMGGQLVADKNFQKTHKINDYLIMSMAGTVSDAQVNHKLIGAQLKIKELKDSGVTTLYGLSKSLNELKIPTRNGGQWYPTTVKKYLAWIDNPA